MYALMDKYKNHPPIFHLMVIKEVCPKSLKMYVTCWGKKDENNITYLSKGSMATERLLKHFYKLQKVGFVRIHENWDGYEITFLQEEELDERNYFIL
jgi:hypothetical protein